MKVGINLFPLERPNLTGIEIYTLRLVEGLLKRKVFVSGYSYTKVVNQIVGCLNAYSYLSRKEKASSLGKLLYNLNSVNKIAGADDVFHGTFFSLPFGLKASRKVVTVHDFAFKKFPHFFDKKSLLFYKMSLDYSLRKADRIICVSKSCFDDLALFYPDKIVSKGRVVYNGFDPPNKLCDNKQDFESLQLGSYLLFVGAHHPRKNLENALNAYATYSKSGSPVSVVLTGNVDNEILSNFLLKHPHLEKSILCLGYVSSSMLHQLYKHAKLLLLPSYHEGFGFPILEAMSVGTPVLTSITSSCKEISGYDNSYLVDPSDPHDIATKLFILLQEDVRKHLISFGYERIKCFSWDKMVAETIEVYTG